MIIFYVVLYNMLVKIWMKNYVKLYDDNNDNNDDDDDDEDDDDGDLTSLLSILK